MIEYFLVMIIPNNFQTMVDKKYRNLYFLQSFVSKTPQLELTLLEPYTEYAISVQVCTLGGCAESPTVNVHTSSDVPQNQPEPVIDNITSTTMNLSWTDPLAPNGKISGWDAQFFLTFLHYLMISYFSLKCFLMCGFSEMSEVLV